MSDGVLLADANLLVQVRRDFVRERRELHHRIVWACHAAHRARGCDASHAIEGCKAIYEVRESRCKLPPQPWPDENAAEFRANPRARWLEMCCAFPPSAR